MTPVQDRTLFLYWGRRGYFPEFVLELAKVSDGQALFSVSRQNELFAQIGEFGTAIEPVDTFKRGLGAIFGLFRIWSIRRQLLAAIQRHRIDKVVVLISHVWTPLIAHSIRSTGARYVVVVHDATNHPGDPTAIVNWWLMRDALKADEVVTLSAHVTSALISRFPQLARRTNTLFLPIIRSFAATRRARSDRPLGFLFFGRILAYKGLPLFVEACELLHARGHDFRIGVAGEGYLGDLADRLVALDAVVINRWLSYDEVTTVHGEYDCIVLSNIEASQSGVVALAHGFGMPVVATPIGGLTEQIKDRHSGLIARSVSAAALADAMELFLTDNELRTQLSDGVAQTQVAFSMARFFQLITVRRVNGDHADSFPE